LRHPYRIVGRTFDEWLNTLPNDVKDDIKLGKRGYSYRPLPWKSIQWTLDVINKTGNNYLFPKPDEIRQWIHSSKGETFDSNKLKEINPTVANVILNQQQKIENLLK